MPAIELDVIREWFAFNARARRGYLNCLAKLPQEELSRDRGASYPTLGGILKHTVQAYAIWIVRASTGDSQLPQVGPAPEPSPGPDQSAADLGRFEQEVQTLVDKFLQGLSEQDLERAVHIPPGIGSTLDSGLLVRDMLWHLVEEELQHRGELNALLWQIEVDPPIFDWIDFHGASPKEE